MDLEIKEKDKKLSDLLRMLNSLPKKNQICDMCGSKTAEVTEFKNFQRGPEVLIINLNNNHQYKINIDLDIKVNVFKYFLYLFIYQEKKNDYKICYKKDGENWYIINDKIEPSKLSKKDLLKYTSSSKVLFYKNEKLLIKNNPIITIKKDETSSENVYVNKVYNENDNPYFGDMKTPSTQKTNIEQKSEQNNFNKNKFSNPNPNQNIQQNNNFQNANMVNNNNINNAQNQLWMNKNMNNMNQILPNNQMNNFNNFPNNLINCNNMNNFQFNNNFNNMMPHNFINNMPNNMMNMNSNNMFMNNNMNMMMNNQNLINNNNFHNNMRNNMLIQNNSNNNNMNQMNINNNNLQKNSNLTKTKGKDMTIFFKLKNDQQFYIDVDETEIFKDVVKKLKEKNKELKDINIKEYRLNNKKIKKKRSIKDLGIQNNSLIDIIVKKKIIKYLISELKIGK